MNKRLSILSNGWTAEFTNRGEFRMGAERWGMLVHGPDGQTIRFFEEQIVLINDHDGKQAQSCLALSDDGIHGYLTDGLEGAWVLDFGRNMIAPHRLRFNHKQGDKYISAFEQPAYQDAREYVRIAGKLIYITFPFCLDEDLQRVLDDYVRVRRRQLDELYFDAR